MERKFQVEDIDESTLQLDQLFHRRMLQLYVTWRDKADYPATRLLGGVRRQGGVEYAKGALRRPVRMQQGFEKVRARLPGANMENLILDPRFQTLFSDWERTEARRRLETTGMD